MTDEAAPLLVETDATKPEARCPVWGCGADLFLTITSCIPLYAVNPPWQGAGDAKYGPDEAVSDGWEVECTDGHKVWTHVDQIRADNAAGVTEDDETGDSAPPFKIDLLLWYVTGAWRRG
jgi:hypothetical protein